MEKTFLNVCLYPLLSSTRRHQATKQHTVDYRTQVEWKWVRIQVQAQVHLVQVVGEGSLGQLEGHRSTAVVHQVH